MKYLAASPATDRLGWLVDGLNGVPGRGGDAADVRQRAAVFAPLAVTGLDTSDHAARARVRVRDDSVHVAS